MNTRVKVVTHPRADAPSPDWVITPVTQNIRWIAPLSQYITSIADEPFLRWSRDR